MTSERISTEPSAGERIALEEWLTPTEAGAYLGGVPPATLAQWRHRRIGPAYGKFGRHIRYHRDTLETWALAQVVPA